MLCAAPAWALGGTLLPGELTRAVVQAEGEPAWLWGKVGRETEVGRDRRDTQ